MEWFAKYSSNTLGAGGNQFVFRPKKNEVQRGRVYYRIFAGGTYEYSLLYSNVTDSTFADGSVSRCNQICDEWELLGVKVGLCDFCDGKTAADPVEAVSLTFGGKTEKTVAPGEFFTSDPVKITAKKGQYLCVEITYRGSVVPIHEESILPAFVWAENQWKPSRNFPFPGMIGCDRKTKGTVGFWGDSITQGCGTPCNAYAHWNAPAAEAMGEEYAFWNLGLGYARASDAASKGAWMFKAKHVDAMVLCFGTNDIGKNHTQEQIIADLTEILSTLQKAGIKVLLQTLPPFNWQNEKLEIWRNVNQYIRENLAKQADAFFDVAPLLTDGPEENGTCKYGGHPNEEGCRVWAEALTPVLREFLEKAFV
ncbi:MAG: hypothetical protein J6M34_06285 [Clostridia bacterium]|nr:hypothetical protein [Clostridia bacterium]